MMGISKLAVRLQTNKKGWPKPPLSSVSNSEELEVETQTGNNTVCIGVRAALYVVFAPEDRRTPGNTCAKCITKTKVDSLGFNIIGGSFVILICIGQEMEAASIA